VLFDEPLIYLRWVFSAAFDTEVLDDVLSDLSVIFYISKQMLVLFDNAPWSLALASVPVDLLHLSFALAQRLHDRPSVPVHSKFLTSHLSHFYNTNLFIGLSQNIY
jgi:hypothetical protein